MENITLGQISNTLLWLVAFVGAIGTIATTILLSLNKIIKKQLEPLNKKIDDVHKTVNKKIDSLDMNDCKNFLVRFLADVERGQPIDEVEIKRAHDVYDHYKNDLGGNSYIADKWNKLMK